MSLFELSPDDDYKTVMELRTRFFKFHTEKSNLGSKGIEPISLVLNPKGFVDSADPFLPDIYYALYYKNYFVTVEQSHISPMFGPHRALLFCQIYPPAKYRQGKREWIGTAMLDCIFHDEERIRISLRRAIRTRQYFIGEKLEEMKINMTPPEDIKTIEL